MRFTLLIGLILVSNSTFAGLKLAPLPTGAKKMICEARLRRAEEPDMDFIVDLLPAIQNPRRVRADADQFMNLLQWRNSYEDYCDKQSRADKRQGKSSYSKYDFLWRLLNSPEGKDYAQTLTRPNDRILGWSAFRDFDRDLGIVYKKMEQALANRRSAEELKSLIAQLITFELQDDSVRLVDRGGNDKGYYGNFTPEIEESIDTFADYDIYVRYRMPRGYDPDVSDPLSLGYGDEPLHFLTTYGDYARVFSKLPLEQGQTFVEVGSGFGRGALVLNLLAPGTEYIGYEIVDQRLSQAKAVARRFDLDATFVKQDVLDPEFKIAPANYYFFYNPKAFDALTPLREQIQAVARAKARKGEKVYVILGEFNRLPSQHSDWLKLARFEGPEKTVKPYRIYEVIP